MKTASGLISLIILGLGSLASWQANAEENRVTFPENLDQLVHYTTVKRGNVVEHMLTSQDALQAIKDGQPIPDKTHFVLVDYRKGEVFRYFVMEKGKGWGADYDEDRRTADWQFQWFKPDKSINMDENTARCQSCHQGQKRTDYLYTADEARQFK
jgi:hypothetical protein